MKTILFRLLAVAFGLALPYAAAEGIYSIVKGSEAHTSLLYDFYSLRLVDRRVPPFDPDDPNTWIITHLGQLEAVFDDLKASGVGIGNSPFDELKLEAVALNTEADGCKVQKPNLHKTVSYLRSNLFNPFDQLTYFHDDDAKLSPELERFFTRYSFRRVRHTSNQYGERLTLPQVDAPSKILIAGDSIANGVMLDDSETMASQLQALDRSHAYVNLGISGAKTSDILCALERAAERYGDHIDAVLYVFCENDFDPSSSGYRTPAELVRWLEDFRRREGIGRVVLLYSPYIYNAVPEITRIRGHSHRSFPTYAAEKKELLRLAATAGFATVDFLDVVNGERSTVASQFAPLVLYVDHTHYSRLGTARIVPRLLQALSQG